MNNKVTGMRHIAEFSTTSLKCVILFNNKSIAKNFRTTRVLLVYVVPIWFMGHKKNVLSHLAMSWFVLSTKRILFIQQLNVQTKQNWLFLERNKTYCVGL